MKDQPYITYHPETEIDAFQVSVIIPVYNAERFVRKAVESALAQPEVREVVLINDGSTDESASICQTLAAYDSRVRYYEHKGGVNRGVAASRNLGIAMARSPYVAFLDSDDQFKRGRFEYTRTVFEKYPQAGGVHEMIGVRYHNKNLKNRHVARVKWEETGIRKRVNPYDLFRTLATGKFGHISLVGLTVKREVIQKYEFDETLRQSEDSDLIYQLSTNEIILPGKPDGTVALRGVHDNNSVFTSDVILESRRRCLAKCIKHDFYGSVDTAANMYIVLRYLKTYPPLSSIKNKLLLGVCVGLVSIGYFLINPHVVLTLAKTAVVPRKRSFDW